MLNNVCLFVFVCLLLLLLFFFFFGGGGVLFDVCLFLVLVYYLFLVERRLKKVLSTFLWLKFGYELFFSSLCCETDDGKYMYSVNQHNQPFVHIISHILENVLIYVQVLFKKTCRGNYNRIILHFFRHKTS